MATCFNRYYPISQQKGYEGLRGLFIVGLIMGGLSLSNLVFAEDAILSWTLENDTSYTVYLKFFSEKGGVWPGNDEVYVLNRFSERTFTLKGSEGEQVCYGAWHEDNPSLYWGVGRLNDDSCSGCCTSFSEGFWKGPAKRLY